MLASRMKVPLNSNLSFRECYYLVGFKILMALHGGRNMSMYNNFLNFILLVFLFCLCCCNLISQVIPGEKIKTSNSYIKNSDLLVSPILNDVIYCASNDAYLKLTIAYRNNGRNLYG
jgi:hypothetical protein